MKKLIVTTILLSLGGLAAAAQPGLMEQVQDMASGSVAGMLESQLGVTSEQAEGGIGSLLGLAKSKLDAGDFDRLAGAIPGADGYLETARSLGAIGSSLSDMADLNAALESLGMSPDTISRFIPAVTDLVGKVGGEEARQLLASALGGA